MAESQKPQYIALRLGMEEDDDLNPPPGTITEARNVRFSSAGAAVPRPSSLAIPSVVANAGGASSPTIQSESEDFGALFQIGNTDAAAMAGTVFAWDSTAQIFEARGNYSTCMPVRKREALALLSDSYGYKRYGMAVNSTGHVCVAAPQTLATITRVMITDANGIPQLHTTVSSASKASVLAFGADFLLVTQDNATLQLNARKLTFSTGVWTVGAPAAITLFGALSSGTASWDIAAESDTVFYCVYQNAVGNMLVEKFSYPGLANTANANFVIVGEPRVSLYADGTNVWVGFNDDPGAVGNVSYRVYTNALALTLGTTIVATSTTFGPLMFGPSLSGSITTAFACYGIEKAVAPFSKGIGVLSVTTAGAVSSIFTFWHVYPRGKPGKRGRVWCTATNGLEWTTAAPLGWQQSRNVLLRFPATAGSVSKVPLLELATDSFEGVLPATNWENTMLPDVSTATSTFAFLPDVLSASTSDRPIRLQVYEYETSAQNPWRDRAQCGATTIIAGQPVELGSQGSANTGTANVIRPSGVPVGFAHLLGIVAAAQGAAGALTAVGKYSWVAVPEWIDPETGRLHQGEPSAPYTTTLTGANNSVTLTITGLMVDPRCTDANLPVTVAIYRTVANQEQLRKETTYSTEQSAIGESITHVSIVPDSALGNLLYTEGGFVAFNLAPSCRFVRRTESAVVMGGLWDRRLIRKSRDFVPGEPTGSSDLGPWDTYLPEDGYGIAYQDGLTFAFGKNAVYIVSGAGPNEQGQGDFDPVRTLTSEFGCESAPSILETSAGVMFLSARGFMLIPRGGGNPVFIGRQIQKSIRSFPNGVAGYGTCLSSTCVTGESRTARFLMTNGGAERVYVYDLDTGAWEYDDYRDKNSGSESATRLAAIGCWNRLYYTSGFVAGHARASIGAAKCALIESSIFGGSDDVTVTSYVKLGDMRPFGLAGWGRCQTVGYVMSEEMDDNGVSTVTGTVTPDGLASSATSRSWASVVNPGATQTIYREIDCGHMQCTAIVVEWTSVRSVSSLARGPSLNGLMILTVAEKGSRLLAPSER
jgi:hypothetical protein